MGIVKIQQQLSANVVPEKLSRFVRAKVGEPFQKQEFLVEDDRKDDFEDCKPMEAEAGCELCTVGGQTCSFPYELYELPDLKGILSLDSWNSLLTEEERFSLASYLPDMDQEMFCLTMSDLLSGDDLFFGCPLEQFFQRMKAGFYSPEAAKFRECSDGLQRLKNYYSLRSYHESMRSKLLKMRRVWSDCQPNATVKEKVCIWNKKMKPNKPPLLVDLNASPVDEEMLNKDKVVATAPSAKIARGRSRSSGFPSGSLIGLAEHPKPKAKGLLKIKPAEMNHAVRPLLSDTSGRRIGPVPKGVLKIKPKADILAVRSEREELSSKEYISFPAHISTDSKTCRSPELSDGIYRQQRDGAIVEQSQKKVRTTSDLRYRNAFETHVGASLLEENRKPSRAAPGKLHSIPEERGKEWFVHGKEPTNPSVVSGIPESEQSSHNVPVTYKRKKASAELTNARSSGKRSRGVADSEPAEEIDCRLASKIKPLKIKIKGRNNGNAQ